MKIEIEEKVKVYLLYHGDPTLETVDYDVKSKYHLINILAGILIVANEKGIVADKAFAYYAGVWYHAVPSETYDNQV